MKRKKRNVKLRNPYDTHHLLWRRRAWDTGRARALRNHWYCSMKLERDGLHRWIHEEVCRIPMPEICFIEDCLKQLEILERAKAIHEDDPIEKRLEILICCFDTGDSPTADALKAQLEAVRNYKPG